MNTRLKIENELNSKNEKLLTSLREIIKNNKSNSSIAVVELTKTGWSDIAFWGTSKNARNLVLGTALSDTVDEELIEEFTVKEGDPDELLNIFVDWINKNWQKLEVNEKSALQMIVLNADDVKGYWLNQSKWIEISDKTLIDNFGVSPK